MDNFKGPGRLRREEQRVFLGSGEIPGVQSVQSSYNLAAAPLKYLGLNTAKFIPKGPQAGSFSISQALISNDVLINYTGENGVNGFILQSLADTSKNYTFTSGYMTSYNLRCSIGEIPQVNATFSILGRVGHLTDFPATADNDITNIPIAVNAAQRKITSAGDINISLSGFATNAVSSFDLTINSNRLPIYALAYRYPLAVQLSYPLEVVMNFTISVGDYQAYESTKFPSFPVITPIAIRLKDYDTEEAIRTYAFPNMLLADERYSAATDANATMTLQYRSILVRRETRKDYSTIIPSF